VASQTTLFKGHSAPSPQRIEERERADRMIVSLWVAAAEAACLRQGEDLRAILGVGTAATPADLKAAFRRQARLLHPDVNPSADAGLAFQRLVRAHEILSSTTATREWESSKGGASERDPIWRPRKQPTATEPPTGTRWRTWGPPLTYILFMYLSWGSFLGLMQPRHF